MAIYILLACKYELIYSVIGKERVKQCPDFELIKKMCYTRIKKIHILPDFKNDIVCFQKISRKIRYGKIISIYLFKLHN